MFYVLFSPTVGTYLHTGRGTKTGRKTRIQPQRVQSLRWSKPIWKIVLILQVKVEPQSKISLSFIAKRLTEDIHLLQKKLKFNLSIFPDAPGLLTADLDIRSLAIWSKEHCTSDVHV